MPFLAALPAILAGVSAAGGLARGASAGRAQGRISEADILTRRDAQRLQDVLAQLQARFEAARQSEASTIDRARLAETGALDRARLQESGRLARSEIGLRAPSIRTRQAVSSDLLGQFQPGRFSRPARTANISLRGGLANLTPGATGRAALGELGQQALRALRTGSDVPPLDVPGATQVPDAPSLAQLLSLVPTGFQQSALPKASGLDKLLNILGAAGGIADVGNVIRQNLPSGRLPSTNAPDLGTPGSVPTGFPVGAFDSTDPLLAWIYGQAQGIGDTPPPVGF